MSGKGGGNMPSDKQMTTLGGPWFPLQDAYKDLIGQIGKDGKKPWEYGPDVVQGLTPDAMQAINSGTQMGLAGNPAFQGATDYAGNIASGGAVGNAPGYSAISNIANNGVDNPVYNSLLKNLQLAESGSGGLQYAQDVAAGKYLNGNPNLDAVVNNSVNNARDALLPSLEGRMSQAGRLGSNAEAIGQGEIAKKLGQVASDIRYGDYNNERQMQQAAGMALPSLLGQEVGVRNNAAQTVSGDIYDRLNMQLNAGSTAADIRNNDINTAMGAGATLGNNFNNQFLGADRTLGYQNTLMTNNQDRAAEEQAKFRYNQSGDYDRINRMLQQYGAIAGTTNPGAASQYAASTMGGPSDFQVGLGNALAIAGTGAQIGGMFLGPEGMRNTAYSPGGYNFLSGMYGHA